MTPSREAEKDYQEYFNSPPHKKNHIATTMINAVLFKISTHILTKRMTKGITVGSTVTIKDGAVYGGLSSARGKTVPAAQRGGKKHTVDKIQVNNGVQEARLKDITSWVAVSSLQAV